MGTRVFAAAAVVAFGVFSFLCLRAHAPAIAADLETKSSVALQGAGLNAISATANGRELTLAGMVADEDIKTRAAQMVGGIAGVRNVYNDLEVESGSVVAPEPIAQALATPAVMTPYRFRIAKRDDVVTLSGVMPDAEARRRLLEHAEEVFGSTVIRDRIDLAPGAPAEWSEALMSVQTEIAQYVEGDARLTGTTIEVRGTLPASRESATSRLAAAIPARYDSDIVLSAPAGALTSDCQTQLDSLLANNRINYSVGSATISSSSFALLDRLGEAVSVCATARIEIAGHTDAQGSATVNQTLSKRRAEAVVNYLLAMGISSEQLVARGYGETRPVGANETAEGRARNRRIEFNVLETDK
ncbi:MAG: OmpA family protein [Gammaproteobacteria bacterium]|nr:OmpA family protein [Gammaproteobacteria bacterium]